MAGSTPERPLIPSALEQKGEAYTTPLPKLSMIVLSIAMLGEFLSANVSTPFLLFMVKGFGEAKDEAEVASWTGILVASFFLTQFVTSLLWATVAQKHGQRAVLFISLLGSAVTVLVFGTCSSLGEAIVIRLLQGVFAGAVGVARGSVTIVTDPSNEGRAYAILGFCWGFGGVAGAVIGGSFESPALKWPEIFGNIPFFVSYPYILPCGIASSITFTGAILSLFLARDGGPREGAIRLHPEKRENARTTIPEEDEPVSPTDIGEEQEPQGVVNVLRNKVSKQFSGYFARGADSLDVASPQSMPLGAAASSIPRPRAYSRTSRADGSAYGYAGSYRRRLASNATRRNSNTSSMRRRRGSNFDGPQTDTGNLNFAQRLLMANENAVTNIADLWVAAAINVDNEDPFESDSDMGSDVEYDSDIEAQDGEAPGQSVHERPAHLLGAHLSPSPNSRRPSTAHGAAGPSSSMRQYTEGIPSSRRGSNAFPAIFSHPGVRAPLLVQDVQQMTPRPDESTDTLAPIRESSRLSESQISTTSTEHVLEKAPSLTSQLPILVILQYGLLALYSTTHDQVFLSYLVSDYESGGLNLNAAHFAQLVALMCLAQMVYQFYLYPNIGPPRGRFSHLAMFRIGSLLFIPAYLTVILYRVFASETDDGNFILMTALAISTAVRYCGNTFAYTSVAILLNYMTPPHAVGYANGVAQSIVSLARCFGPVLGGYLWAATTKDNPGGYYIGFLVCAAVASAAIAHSFVIR
ncbi:major facilitator superfamily MFS-1 [Athelia psychrophila]|uniref:Major facilitator superfamily MFS-1 n=1 Tax=Athelia psychrophila TaxID=1759441 RepID=A0A166EHC9_9AGAM|nr:major facilitator superfamily MFS-1 [Fibularhizoctonia sp. CBS 109695]